MESTSTSLPRAVMVLGRSRSINLSLGLIFLLALALRLIYLFEVRDVVLLRQLVVDAQAYDEWAVRIAAGDWVGTGPFYQDPLYPYLLAVLYRAFGRHLMIVYVIQIVISAAAVFPLYGIGRRCFGDARVGLLAALFWALYKVDFFFEAQIEKTGPGIALVILGLWLLCALRDRPKISTAALAGFTLGLWPLFRGNFLAVVPLLFVWLAVSLWRETGRRALPVLAVFAALCLLPPAACLVRNRLVAGEWIVTTAQGGVNFYVGNYRENEWGVGRDPSWGRRTPVFEQSDFLAEARRRTGKSAMTWSEMDRFWYREGFREIAAAPGDYFLRLGRKALLIVNRHEVPDNLNYDFFRENYSRMLAMPLPAFWLAGPFGAAGLALALRRRRGALPCLFIFAYAASLLAFYVVDRYRLPLVPPLLLFASYGAVSAPAMVKSRDRAALALYGGTLVIALGLAYPQWRSPHYDQSYLKLGHAYSREQNWERALASYERSLELNSESGQAWLGYGLVLEARLRFPEALAAYERAAALDPGHAGSHFLYARALERAGRFADAAAEYRKALDLDPSLSEAKRALSRLPPR